MSMSREAKRPGMVLYHDKYRALSALSDHDFRLVIDALMRYSETGEQAESASDALYSIFYFTAFIAVNLAIMNMLPIPALDGGRVFLLIVTWIIESISRKKLDPKYEGYIHAAGMVLLLGLMAIIMFNDIIRIVTK